MSNANNARVTIEHKWMYNEEPVTPRKGSGSLTYTGFTAWTYGTELACKYPKQKTVLLNDNFYSGYSSRHRSRIQNAIPKDWGVLYVSPQAWRGAAHISDKLGLKMTLENMFRISCDHAATVRKPVNAPQRANAFEDFSNAYLRYCSLAKFMKRKPKGLKHFGLDIGAESVHFKAYEARKAELRPIREAAAKKARETRDANERAKWAEEDRLRRERADLYAKTYDERETAWKAGKGARFDTHDGTILLRLSLNGKFVETSQGVAIPVPEALKLFLLAKTYKVADAEARAKIAAKVGGTEVAGFKLLKITDGGDVTVGCHHIKFGEMEKCFNEYCKKA